MPCADDIRDPSPRLCAAALVLAALLATPGCERGDEPPRDEPPPVAPPPAAAPPVATLPAEPSPLSTTYRLSGRTVALQNGRHETPAAPGSAALDSTAVWGTPLVADLDGDGDEDAVVILENRPGGSGTFYYLAAAERDGNAFSGSDGVLLGDRVALQNMSFEDGVVTVNLADRRAGEPFTAQPSLAVSRRFSFAEHELREVADGAAAARAASPANR